MIRFNSQYGISRSPMTVTSKPSARHFAATLRFVAQFLLEPGNEAGLGRLHLD